MLDYNINIVVDPGETKTVTFKAKKKGVYPYYCTNFCSALHQEMQGYMIVQIDAPSGGVGGARPWLFSQDSLRPPHQLPPPSLTPRAVPAASEATS